MSVFIQASQDKDFNQKRVESLQVIASAIQRKLGIAEQNPTANASEIATLKSQLSSTQNNLASATADFEKTKSEVLTLAADIAADPTSTIKTPGATNIPNSDIESYEKNKNSEVVGDTAPTNTNLPSEVTQGEIDSENRRKFSGIPSGAELVPSRPAPVNVISASGKPSTPDLRVRIKVPSSYYLPSTNFSKTISEFGGVIFPYTPEITYDHKAEYSSQNPVHSNFTQYFYKHSAISSIKITGKFTVQNENDADVLLSTIHLLRSLTKMKSGGLPTSGGAGPTALFDVDSGAPPPVCRLFAYGPYMLDNVPIVISSFSHSLPSSVDYYAIGKLTPHRLFGITSVPVISDISLICHVVYSREEMRKFSVNGWLNGNVLRKSGML